MAIFGKIDTGLFSLNQGPSSGKVMTRATTINVQAPFGIGGAVAGSRQAVRYAVQQLVELAHNPQLQPVYVEWESGNGVHVANPYDGWYRLDDVTPLDFSFNTFVPCRVSATWISPQPPTAIFLAHSGGSVPTDFSGPVKNLVAAPLNSTLLQGTALRSGAEGLIPYVGNPVNPAAVALSATVADRFKGGVRVFDTLNSAAFAVPAQPSIQTLFRSIGTDATGTLNAWTNTAGWAIASNLVTSPASAFALMNAGHADWWDCTVTVRIKWVTGAFPRLAVHNSAAGFIWGSVDGVNLYIDSFVVAGGGANIGSIPAALVNGTFYWLRVQASGNVYTVSLFNDSAGAIGSQIGTVGGTANAATIAALSVGNIALGTGSATACTFGGAFANVCQVTGPWPAGWGATANVGEPAFCWSQVSPSAGRRSISIYNKHVGATGSAGGPGQTYNSGGTYTVGAQIKLTGTAPAALWQFTDTLKTISNPPPDGAWHIQTATGATNAANYTQLVLQAGGLAYFDMVTIQDAAGNFLFGDGFEPDRSAMWVEVFDPQHNFAGDCVITNGVLLYQIVVGRNDSGLLYLWNPALAAQGLQLIGSPIYYDNASVLGTLQSYSLVAVGAEESSLRFVSSNASGSVAEVLVRLQRGRYGARMRFKPKTQASTTPRGLAFSSNIGNLKVIYNPLSIGDPSRAQGLGGIPTDYGYAAGFVANANAPVVMGWLVPKKVTGNQGWSDGVAQIAPGDITSLPIDGEREYVFFAIPYGVTGLYSTANLQAEAEAGSLGTGWSSVNDGGTQAAKCASGTLIGNTDDNLFGTGRQYAPGTYRVWFEVRVASNASGVGQMQFSFYDETAAGVLASAVIAPNAIATTYGWYSPGTLTITAGHTHHAYIQTAATLTTDWFINQVVLVPITELASNRDAESGPQDLWSQEMYDRTVVMVPN